MKKSANLSIFFFAVAFILSFFALQNHSYALPRYKKPVKREVQAEQKQVFNRGIYVNHNRPAASKRTTPQNKNVPVSQSDINKIPRLKIGIPSSGRTVVIEIDLESYLNGVVGGEMSTDWPMEALKAQAVAARTFSLYSKGRHQKDGYDLCATTHCQIYDGITTASESVKKAVAATQGEVITYGGKPIYAAFHADSGGCTADCAEVWGSDLPYLKHVKDGEGSPQRHWQANYTAAEIEAKLRAASKDIGNLKKISLDSRTDSGRVKNITFSGTKKNITLSGTQARQVLGLKSAMFNISGGKNIRIDGYGSGHGLGLSQWGAYRQSAKKSYREILNLYYTGVRIEKLY